jgi:hypothetical protein
MVEQQEHVLSAKDIIVDLCQMHYGMQEKNPLDFINFYSKHNPNSKLAAIDSTLGVRLNGTPSRMFSPWTWGYLATNAGRLRRGFTACFHSGCPVCRHRVPFLWRLTIGYRYFGVIQAGYREVLRTMSVLDEADPSRVSSPATEAPSTPRTHSRNRSFGTPRTTRSNNNFTTVPFDHVPLSPSHPQNRSKSKRDRDTSLERQAGPAKKKRGG